MDLTEFGCLGGLAMPALLISISSTNMCLCRFCARTKSRCSCKDIVGLGSIRVGFGSSCALRACFGCPSSIIISKIDFGVPLGWGGGGGVGGEHLGHVSFWRGCWHVVQKQLVHSSFCGAMT